MSAICWYLILEYVLINIQVNGQNVVRERRVIYQKLSLKPFAAQTISQTVKFW